MGIMGACRSCELSEMKICDIKEFGTSIIVTIPNTKTKIIRNFTITGDFYCTYKKYANLRPNQQIFGAKVPFGTKEKTQLASC